MVFLKKTSQQIEQLNSTLQNSFSGVKRDMKNVFDWLNFLHQKNQQQNQIITNLKNQINNLPKTKEELRELIDEYYGIPLHSKVDSLHQRMDSVEQSNKTILDLKFQLQEIKSKVSSINNQGSVDHLTSRIEQIKEQIRDIENTHDIHIQEHSRQKIIEKQPEIQKKTLYNLRENLIKKIAKSGKDHVKTIMKSLIIKYGKISALQLRDIIVDEQGLCSKSSFYRILEEIDDDEDITVINEKKQKKYVFNAIKIK